MHGKRCKKSIPTLDRCPSREGLSQRHPLSIDIRAEKGSASVAANYCDTIRQGWKGQPFRSIQSYDSIDILTVAFVCDLFKTYFTGYVGPLASREAGGDWLFNSGLTSVVSPDGAFCLQGKPITLPRLLHTPIGRLLTMVSEGGACNLWIFAKTEICYGVSNPPSSLE